MAQDIYQSNDARRRTASREAAVWLARLDLGTADPQAFERWRTSHVEHQVAFARVVGASEAATADPEALSLTKGLSRRGLLRAGTGVGVFAMLGLGGLSTRAYAWSNATSRIGECRTVRLPDGSGARLNTGSSLSWRFRENRRTLWIERGEVALDIQTGPDCMLHGSGKQVVLSVGRYNARLRGATLDLLVMRGEASVPYDIAAGTPISRASAGEGILMPVGLPVVRSTTADELAASLAWQQGEILFQHETLGSAVEDYNRYLNRKIVIVDRDLADIPVGGRFTSNDPGAFLRALNVGLGVQVSSSETGYLLTR